MTARISIPGGPARRAIAFFNPGDHGLTVFGMAVQIWQRHGHGEDAMTAPLDVLQWRMGAEKTS